jgi:hypothetical protein
MYIIYFFYEDYFYERCIKRFSEHGIYVLNIKTWQGILRNCHKYDISN